MHMAADAADPLAHFAGRVLMQLFLVDVVGEQRLLFVLLGGVAEVGGRDLAHRAELGRRNTLMHMAADRTNPFFHRSELLSICIIIIFLQLILCAVRAKAGNRKGVVLRDAAQHKLDLAVEFPDQIRDIQIEHPAAAASEPEISDPRRGGRNARVGSREWRPASCCVSGKSPWPRPKIKDDSYY